MHIAIGSDHAGFTLKEKLKQWFEQKNICVTDKGTYSDQSVDYPDYASKVAHSYLNGEVDCGILICGSGNGMAMSANKFRGIRAALCWNPEIARLAKLHNNANILVMPGRFINYNEAVDIIIAYLGTTFEGGRHQGRIDKMNMINQEL